MIFLHLTFTIFLKTFGKPFFFFFYYKWRRVSVSVLCIYISIISKLGFFLDSIFSPKVLSKAIHLSVFIIIQLKVNSHNSDVERHRGRMIMCHVRSQRLMLWTDWLPQRDYCAAVAEVSSQDRELTPGLYTVTWDIELASDIFSGFPQMLKKGVKSTLYISICNVNTSIFNPFRSTERVLYDHYVYATHCPPLLINHLLGKVQFMLKNSPYSSSKYTVSLNKATTQ